MILAAALALLAGEGVAAPAAASPILDTGLVAEVRLVAERVGTLRAATFPKDLLALRASDSLRQAAVDARAAALVPPGHAAARGRAWADIGLGEAATPANLVAILAADLPEVCLDADGRRLLVAPGTLPDTDFVSDSSDDPKSTVFLATGVRPDEPLIAHALVHLLQRQRGSGGPARVTTTDAALAGAAWAEGEANFIAIRFLFHSMGVGDSVFEHNVDPTRVLEGRLVGVAIDALPAAERSLLGFVHQEGLAQVVSLYRAGGWRAIDQATAVRTSTRDLLHPDRAGAAAAADLGAGPAPEAGLSLADEDTIGEEGIIALVSSRTGKDDLALVAGDGWRGDRLRRWEPETSAEARAGITVWDSSWASEDEAKEFVYAVGRAIEDGMAGEPLTESVENRRSWLVSGKTYQLDRQAGRVSLRIETKKPSAAKPAPG